MSATNSGGSFQMSRKRKRGGGYSILDAAQKGGSIARTEYINQLKSNSHPRKHIAQLSTFIPTGRSAVRHISKSESLKKQFENRPNNHVHDMLRKYYRGKPVNGVKSFLKTIQT